MKKEDLLRYTHRLEEIIIRKERKIQAMLGESDQKGLVCSISNVTIDVIADLRHNISNLYFIYHSSFRKSHTQTAENRKREKRVYNLLKRINNQEQILLGLLNKLQEGVWTLPAKENYVDSNLVISNCVQQIRGNPSFFSGVEIKLELNRHIPELEIQRSDLYHIVYNLITNSIEAIEKNGAGKIKIDTDMQNGDIIIRILDNGEGIAQKISRNIFDPYFSTRRSGENGPKHHGLGLYSINKIVKANNGTVEFESSHTNWTVFTIRLPIHHKMKGSSGSMGKEFI